MQSAPGISILRDYISFFSSNPWRDLVAKRKGHAADLSFSTGCQSCTNPREARV
jgi:hypothetical protein